MLSKLVKTKAHRVMGIDGSTNSIAFCVFYNRKPIKYGIINIVGSDIYEKAGDANKKIKALKNQLNVDYIVIESAIFVKSPKTAIQLATVFGSIIGELVAGGAKVITVTPLQWQNYIGNKPFSKEEKANFIASNPGRKKSWIDNEIRKIRKKRTMDFFNKRFKLSITDDNVSDAVGLAFFGYYQLTARA